jgi:hypothetical protein
MMTRLWCTDRDRQKMKTDRGQTGKWRACHSAYAPVKMVWAAAATWEMAAIDSIWQNHEKDKIIGSQCAAVRVS